IDKGAMLPLKDTGRAYFGGYIEGNVNVMDFAEYSDATGNMASTLTYPLARHIQRLNKIRAAVPALRKGQYSTEGCSGNLSFKRRYKDGNVDSYVLVTISGNSTFTNILNGTYVDAVTGDIKNVANNTLTAECSGKGNMRVYVLNGPGKIGDDGKYLYNDESVDQPWAAWPDETMPDDTWTIRPVEGEGSTGININIPADDANTVTEYLNLQGVRITQPATSGIYIVKKGNKVSKSYIRK
ncbi:MAG: alpha-amylase, partial [Prevotella sp.]|nr:alpha-amylase [Prevotella sp.]